MKENKQCSGCIFFDREKVHSPKDHGYCGNSESKKHKEVLPVTAYCWKHTEISENQPIFALSIKI